MTLPAGASLGPYRIVSPLGAGGMGVVYRARDTRLGRDVAIKVVAGTGAQDPSRRARFEQEARAAAALNHPHIVAVYDVGVADLDGVATPYVVSELLEGESLRDRMARGKVPPRTAIEIAAQIAKGLAAAHDHGIVHRDIKPENVWVSKDGTVKVLDFGLAKLREQPTATENGSTTLGGAALGTDPGVVLGTVGYMAPEQVRGESVDHRADLFALGCVLYELVSGQRAFQAATAVETLSAILNTEPPDLTARAAEVPSGLERIVRRCLAKDAGQRFQSARDLAFALEAIGNTQPSTNREASATSPVRGLKRWRETTAWAIAAGALVLLGWRFERLFTAHPPTSSAPLFAELSVPANVVLEESVTVSPDGTTIVFVGSQEGVTSLWRRRLDEPEARLLDGTRGAAMPFWSPDGRVVAFFAGGKLRRIPAEGGPAADICEVVGRPRGGTWSPSGTIVLSREGGAGLERVAADGSGRRLLTEAPAGERHEHPVALVDGTRVVFTVAKGPFGSNASEAHVASLEGGPPQLLARDARRPTIVAGFLVFARGQALVARPIDVPAGESAIEIVLARDIADTNPSQQPYGLSPGGTLVYTRRMAVSGMTRLTWLDRSGRTIRVVGDAGVWSNVEPSPRGDRFVLTKVDPERGQPELWILDAAVDRLYRLATEPGRTARALWAPDGERVLYSFSTAETAARSKVAVRPANGTSQGQVIVEREFDVFPDGWSADGRYVLFAGRNSRAGAGGVDQWKTDLQQRGPDVPIVQTPFDETQAHISPDDRWVAYTSNESGRLEVYVAPFGGGAGRWQVSAGGGQTPRWRPDGRELFYLALDGSLMVVDVDRDAAVFTSGQSVRLFNVGLTGGIPRYAVTADGQRMLAAVPDADARSSVQLGLVANWEALLTRR